MESGPASKRRMWPKVLGVVVLAVVVRAIYVAVFPPADRCPEHEIDIPLATTYLQRLVPRFVAAAPGFRSIIPQPVTDIPIAPNIDEIPEYHDCQRFIVDGGFAALVAIWVSEAIAQTFPAPQPAAVTPVEPSGIRVAERTAVQPVPQPATAVETFVVHGAIRPREAVEAHAVAVLHSTAPGYGPLGVQAGFNCLYMWQTGPSAMQWGAMMQPVLAEDLESCTGSKTLDAGAAGTALEVRRANLQAEGLKPDDVAPVARFDREPKGGLRYLIVIQCGDSWCQVGPSGTFTGLAAGWVGDEGRRGEIARRVLERNGQPSNASGMWKRVTSVKGWDDEQELAIWDAAAGGLKPSGVVGTIVPDPKLEELKSTDSAAFDGIWTSSASIYVTADYNGRKLQLQQGVSLLSVCRGKAEQCEGVPEATPCTAGPDGAIWWGRLEAPDETVSFGCTKRKTHGGVVNVIGAGAARWRWLETDETTWIRCAEGCCTQA